jgi:hypothetical protein
MQPSAIYQAFKDKNVTLCTDDTNITIAMILHIIYDNSDYQNIFQKILKNNFEYIFKRLQQFGKII